MFYRAAVLQILMNACRRHVHLVMDHYMIIIIF